jgi:predicted dehydrogenase
VIRSLPPHKPARVVLAGAHGHGSSHLRNIRRLAQGGGAALVGVCDIVPVPAEALSGLGRPAQGRDLAGLLEDVRPDITIVSTPIQTHADLAVTAMEAGSHVLLEKPPAPSRAEYERILSCAERTRRACQVGFQDLGSQALPVIARMIDEGTIGHIQGIGGACAWVRPMRYFTRSPWAGRRTMDGGPVVDGALTNPFAHAIASALYIAGVTGASDLTGIEVELYHANPIESDDTSCVRIHTRGGPPITIAATLCAAVDHEPYLVVHGSRGRITLLYRRGEIRLESDDIRSTAGYPCTDLLENLIAHTVDPDAVELLVPLHAMEGFMAVIEAVRTAPDPTAIPAPVHLRVTDELGERLTVSGIDELVTASSETLSLYSELGAPWASAPICRVFPAARLASEAPKENA